MGVQVVVLCAGKGTRMKSEKSKVMHEIMGKPIVDYVYYIAKEISTKKPIFIVGHQKQEIISYFDDKVQYVHQDEQLGTGHAIMLSKDSINEQDDVLILYGDTPLITLDTIKEMINSKMDNTDAVILTSILKNPFGYGRIIKDENDNFDKIVEQKDANEKEQEVKEINSGMYFISGKLIKENIDKINNNNSQKEYYITDLFEILKKQGKIISTYKIDKDEILGINTKEQLEEARKIIQKRINTYHMKNGVTLISTDSIIKDNVKIRSSFLEESYVDEETSIGPYAHLRPKSKLGKKVKIGNFVEVKNASIGDDSKASHLAYVGDANVGKNVNIGCGVIFVNYDGKNKNQTVVKDGAFVGSNSNLVAPVILEERAYVACGSTVTKNVPENSLCVARAKQVIKAQWGVNRKY